MRIQVPRAGVCILRVEVESDRILITVTANRNIDRDRYPAGAEPALHFTDTAEALSAVAEFLQSFSPERQV